MTYNWYALHVKPHKERAVCDLLETKEIEVFYPCIKVKPVNPRARKERPFFPGYMFVYIDLEDLGANTLRWTEGTHGLVEFGGEPAIVPENFITELNLRLEKIKESGWTQFEEFKKGDQVQIIEGALEGYEAIFDLQLPGKNRVQVLLTYLSKHPKRLQLDVDQIKRSRHQ